MTSAAVKMQERAHALGFEPMDAIHDEFVELLQRLQDAPDAGLAQALARMQEHLQAHFTQENTWMQETEFPPRGCHIDEHAAVLQSVQDVRALLDQGDMQASRACRSLTQALADWFPGHATHLDSALAHWMCKLRFGGKPLVFRRL